MVTSKEGIELIKKFEGCRLSAYRCPAGIWTIGYGHTLGVRSGDIITKEQAEEFLIQDLKKAEKQVESMDDKYHWTQNEFDALVSFAYNVGNIIGLTAAGGRTKKQISDAMLLYVRGGGVVLPGLVNRRKAEYDMFVKTSQDPVIPAPKKSTRKVVKKPKNADIK